MNSEEMKNRLKNFAINVAKLTQQLPDTLLNKIYKGQIIRSGSSAAASYRASQGARSRPDLINKRKIVEEELDEILFFPAMLEEFNQIRRRDSVKNNCCLTCIFPLKRRTPYI